MSKVGQKDVVAKASQALFGKPLVTNVYRAHIAETIVALAIEPEWKWCSADYWGWDFENSKGVRLEIKQSAARQSWANSRGKPSTSSFDIRPREMRWEGDVKIEESGRFADIYCFCYHPIASENADHRDPYQWEFFVVPTIALPDQKSISLNPLRKISGPVGFENLMEKLAEVANDIAIPRR